MAIRGSYPIFHDDVSVSIVRCSGLGPSVHRPNERDRALLDGSPHLFVERLPCLARELKELPESIDVQSGLHRDERHLACPRHDRDRHVRHVVLLERREVEERRGRVHAPGDGADEVVERDAGGDERERRGVDAGGEEGAVLLEDVDVDVDLGAGVERRLDDGLEGGGDHGGKLEYSSICLAHVRHALRVVYHRITSPVRT